MPANPADVARAWFEEVWNRGDERANDRMMADDATFHGLAPPAAAPVVGPEGFKPFFRQFKAAFPDIHVAIAELVCEGEKVAVHCTVTGTHRGDSLGAAPTQKPISITGMGIARVRDGKIVEAWNAFDFIALYRQLGLTPPA